MASLSGGRVTFYRGQKEWHEGMLLQASSLRRVRGTDPVVWTNALLAQISELVRAARLGDDDARNQLESQLLTCQQMTFQNPFVSCTFDEGVAVGFALDGGTGGFVLTLEGDLSDGLDFEALRAELGLFRDNVDYLREFGIPFEVGSTVALVRVVRVDSNPLREVRVYP